MFENSSKLDKKSKCLFIFTKTEIFKKNYVQFCFSMFRIFFSLLNLPLFFIFLQFFISLPIILPLSFLFLPWKDFIIHEYTDTFPEYTDTFHKPFFLFLIISNRTFLYSKKAYIKILTPKDSSGFLFWSFLYALQKINIVSFVYLCHQHNLYDFDLYKSLNLDVFTNYSQNHLNGFKDNVFNTFI